MTRSTLALFTLVITLGAAAQPQPRARLLRDTVPQVAGKVTPRRGAKRARFVEIDPNALADATLARGQARDVDRSIAANLFAEVLLPVDLKHVERFLTGTVVWTGSIPGVEPSAVTIAVHDDVMTATFSAGAKLYEIRPTAYGVHEAIEVDQSQFDDDDVTIPVPAMTMNAIAAADAASTWDVLIAWTNTVRSIQGGTSAMQTIAANAVAAANTAYANSGVTSRLRLLGTMEVTFNETASDYSTMLSLLRGTGDGSMDGVHTQRNAVGADVVSLIAADTSGSPCGIGYVMSSPPSTSFASNAFSVVNVDCAVGYFSFAHELGHNFGLDHDRANAPGGTPSYQYAFGYQDTAQQFRDIMAYNCPAGCPRIQYFSTPDVYIYGRPLGVNYLQANSADNVRALNNNASIIANFKQAVSTTPTFTDDPLVAGTTAIKAIHITELRTAVNSLRTRAGLSTISSWTDASLSGGVVKAVHITELRNALTPALSALGTTATYTDASLVAGAKVKAIHLQELRNYTK